MYTDEAEDRLCDGSIAKKPKNLSFSEAAAMPLAWITGYEALVERMEIQKGEMAGILFVDGSGGMVALLLSLCND